MTVSSTGQAAGLRDDVLALADELDALRWDLTPFSATFVDQPGHDHEVDDVTAEGQARRCEALAGLAQRAEELRERALAQTPLDDDAEASPLLDPATQVTLAAVLHSAHGLVAELDAALVEMSVGPMADGPGVIFQLAAVTVPADAAGAAAYAERCRRLSGYLDACADRLLAGSAAGRTPVRAVVERALAMLDGYLASAVADDPLLAVPAPPGWEGEAAWRAELEAAVRDVVRPAAQRYREVVAGLLPGSRGDEAPGLVHTPGGREVYDRLVLVHTTLPVGAQELHDLGLAAVAELREQFTEVGARLGHTGFDAVRDAARAAARRSGGEQALAAARAVVARAEAALPGWFAEPLPPPCRVEPMSPHLGKAGTPPHYTPPTADGRRTGAYWFNVDEVGVGAGWDLAATAYHEAVPGHHLQLERMLTRTGLPAVQRLGFVTAHAEGWGLYAELLAGEMGLYETDEELAGSLVLRMFRAARLVVDSGLHALGWSRSQAVDYVLENVPLNATELISEIDRYITMPGQALAYYTGFAEILRLRDEAQATLGDAFDLAGFHAAVLDSGGVPLPALRTAVAAWVGAVRAAA